MSTKIIKKRATSADDIREIKSLLTAIIGKSCWQVRLSYEEEVLIDIGEKISYLWVKDGREFVKTKGEFIIASYCTSWILMKSGNTVVRSSEGRDAILEKLSGLVGNLVTNIEINHPKLALTIFIGSDYVFSITPQTEDDEIGLPYWQVYFTSSSKILEGGPGTSFALVEHIQNSK